MKLITQDWVGLGEDQAVHGHTMQRRSSFRLLNGRFWRKAVGRINDLIGSSELVYSKVIRPPIGTLDADQGTQSAL